ncbi:hypothetical protein GE061_003118 [Apolygus lucorum]|uniref:Uncharacterized protein n=1 Tax=Apolygus lucorum TaxID=248454 RepID=A0A6A4JKV3_APOLU|nr:hypothetical protein GE061_003118 [Apolygus lucorum]
MKVLILLAAVAACAHCATASPRSYGDDDGMTVVEVDHPESDDNSLEDAVIREEISDLDQEPEDALIPQGNVEVEVGGENYESEIPELPEEFDVAIVVDGDDSIPQQDDTTTTTGASIASDSAPMLPRSDVYVSKSNFVKDRLNMRSDLLNLINALKSEKEAFDHMLDRTSQMKMDLKTQCLSEALANVTSTSVDATALDKMKQNLSDVYNKLNSGDYDTNTLEKFKEEILTGTDTFIVQILDESAKMTETMETAFRTNSIDSKC